MAIKYFEWVLFNTKSGTIIDTLEPKEDKVTLDVNSTDTLEITVPFPTLTNVQRKNITEHFKPMNKSIAILRLNSSGERIGCIAAAIITQRELDTEDQSIYIQASGFSDYLSKIPASWFFGSTTSSPSSIRYEGRPDQIYSKIINDSLNVQDIGISTVESWDLDFSTADQRTGTFDIPENEFWSAMDAIETCRDEIFNGKSAELKWTAKLDVANNKIVWTGRTSGGSSSQFNLGDTPYEADLKASQNPQELEVIAWDINEDSTEIYNYLVIDATENESYFIKSKDATKNGDLTLFQSLETGVMLTPAQMDAQLNSRTEGADISEKEATLVLAGSSTINFIPYARTSGTNYLNDNFLGRRFKTNAGSKSSGMGITLRCTEITFSTFDFDINLQLMLQDLSNTYPTLPSKKKSEKKKKDTRSKKKSNKKNTKKKGGGSGGDPNIGSGEWNFGAGDDNAGGKDTEEAPQLKPDTVGRMDDTDLTLFDSIGFLNGYVSDARKSPVFWKDGYGYEFEYKATLDPNSNSGGPLVFKCNRIVSSAEVDTNENVIYSNIGDNQKTMFEFPFNMEFFESYFEEGHAPLNYPLILASGFSDQDMTFSNGISDFNIHPSATNISPARMFAFVVNGRPYFQFIRKYMTGQYYPVYGTNHFYEVFMTADFKSDMTGFENFEVLKSPAQQIWGSSAKHKIISFGTLGSGDFGKSRNGISTADFVDMSSTKNSSIIVFPYTDVATSYQFIEGSSQVGGPILSVAETRDNLKVSHDQAQGKFGWLEANFTNKQPIFKESSISPPWKRVVREDTNGRSASGLTPDTFDRLGPRWDGYNGWSAKDNYSYAAGCSYWGIALSPHFAVSEDQMNWYWQIADEIQRAEFEKKWCNKVFLRDKFAGNWEEVTLPTKQDIKTQVSVWTAPLNETVFTYGYGGRTLPMVAMNGAGKQNKLRMASLSEITDANLPWRGYSTLSRNTNHKNFVNFNVLEDQKLFAISAIGISPYKVEPMEATSARGLVKVKEGYWLTADAGSLACYGENPFTESITKSSQVSWSNSYARSSRVKIDFAKFDYLLSYATGIDSNGFVWHWGLNASDSSSTSEKHWDEFITKDNDQIIWEPVKIDETFKAKELYLYGKTQTSNTNSQRFLRTFAIGEDGFVYYWGFTNAANASVNTWSERTKIDTGNVKFTKLMITNKGIIGLDESLSLWYSGTVFSSVNSPTLVKLSAKNSQMNVLDGMVKEIIDSKVSNNHGVITTDKKVWMFGPQMETQTNDTLIQLPTPFIPKRMYLWTGLFNWQTANRILLIDEDGFLYQQNQGSGKFNQSFELKNLPEDFKAESLVMDYDFMADLQYSGVQIFGKLSESILTQSNALVSGVALNPNPKTFWQPDGLGSFGLDPYVMGSEIFLSSIIPIPEEMPDDEGSDGIPIQLPPWVVSQTPHFPDQVEGEVVDEEGANESEEIAEDQITPETWYMGR